MEQLTKEDLRNILLLVSVAPIKGGDSMEVALLQQKLQKILEVPPLSVKREKEEEKKDK